jgi:hypothetical protein
MSDTGISNAPGMPRNSPRSGRCRQLICRTCDEAGEPQALRSWRIWDSMLRRCTGATVIIRAIESRRPRMLKGLAEELWNLYKNMYKNGPVWDGDVISKRQRDELVKQGLCWRYNGYNMITLKGKRLIEVDGVTHG